MYKIAAFSSIFDSFFYSDFFGKIIFIFLFILSIISWTIMIHKMMISKKIKNNSLSFERSYVREKEKLLSFDLSAFSSIFNPYYVIYSSVKQKTLELLNKNKYFADERRETSVFLSSSDIELIEAQVGAIISKEVKKLEKNLFILSTIITLAPFLGLLGTVWGILLTFSSIKSGVLSNANSAVLSGLSMALGTTVSGLVVAIPPLIGYNYLKNSIRDFSKEMEFFSHNLLTALEIQYRHVDRK